MCIDNVHICFSTSKKAFHPKPKSCTQDSAPLEGPYGQGVSRHSSPGCRYCTGSQALKGLVENEGMRKKTETAVALESSVPQVPLEV